MVLYYIKHEPGIRKPKITQPEIPSDSSLHRHLHDKLVKTDLEPDYSLLPSYRKLDLSLICLWQLFVTSFE